MVRLLPCLLLLASVGCYRSHRLSGVDEAGMRDAGVDAARDAGTDGGVDAQPDAGSDAGRDAGPPVPQDAGPPPVPPPECLSGSPRPPPPSDACELRLRVLDVMRDRPSCFVDEMVEGRPGVLRYACGGGPAELIIAGRSFRGEVSPAGRLELCLGTRFDWTDGCAWISTQMIWGDVRAVELAFAYRETPEPPGPCARPCEASARVVVD